MQRSLVITASTRYRYGLLAVAALLALLQPLMTPWVPSLAGWLPGHQHIYVNGVPVEHSHPWDNEQRPDAESPSGVPAGYVFHLCDIHPDGLVPIGDVGSEKPADGSERSGEAADDVVFAFDLGVSSVFLPAPASALATCPCAPIVSIVVTDPAGPSFATHPTPPPPRL